MTPEVKIGIIISIVSLGVSIISLCISWRALARDRNDLAVKVEFLLESKQGTAFIVRLVNKGRRPIIIENILLRLKSGKELIPKLDSPRIVLDENESCVLRYSPLSRPLHG